MVVYREGKDEGFVVTAYFTPSMRSGGRYYGNGCKVAGKVWCRRRDSNPHGD